MKKIVMAIALLAVGGSVCAQNEVLLDGVAAVVGKNIVKYSDIERSYAQMRLHGTTGDAQTTRCAILENMILTQMLVHKAEVDSLELTDEELDYYVNMYLENDLAQYGTKEALREATGFAYDELKEEYGRMLRTTILSSRMQYQLTDDVKVTPGQVQDFFAKLDKIQTLLRSCHSCVE